MIFPKDEKSGKAPQLPVNCDALPIQNRFRLIIISKP